MGSRGQYVLGYNKNALEKTILTSKVHNVNSRKNKDIEHWVKITDHINSMDITLRVKKDFKKCDNISILFQQTNSDTHS